MVDGKKTIKADVVAFDIVNDLALLKVPVKFSQVLKVRPGAVKDGDKIFSIGLPKDLGMSIVEGNYNGILKEGIYENILMSSPINSGMSGGPTLNKNSDVVGARSKYHQIKANPIYPICPGHASRHPTPKRPFVLILQKKMSFIQI